VTQTRRKRRRPTEATVSLPALLEGLLPPAEWGQLEQALLSRPPKAIRLRPAAAFGQAGDLAPPFPTEPVPWYSGGCFCPTTEQPGRFLAHAAGAYFVQDAGSMLALRLLDAQPGEAIADLCAAPGAKAAAILETVGPGGGLLLANEPIRGRLPPLIYNLARVGFPRFVVTATDPEQLESVWAERFAAVLVDAPCTGQTLVGKGRQSLAAFTSARVAHAAARQRRILAAAAQLVQQGGRLVYSTCTLAAEENEQVIADFLRRHDHWQEEPVAVLARWRSPLAPGGYRLYPHRDRCAGAYAVRLRRAGALPATPSRRLTGGADREPLVIGEEAVGPPRLCLRARGRQAKLPIGPASTGCRPMRWPCDEMTAGGPVRRCNSPTSRPASFCRGRRCRPDRPAGRWRPGGAIRWAGCGATATGPTTACQLPPAWASRRLARRKNGASHRILFLVAGTFFRQPPRGRVWLPGRSRPLRQSGPELQTR